MHGEPDPSSEESRSCQSEVHPAESLVTVGDENDRLGRITKRVERPLDA
jgi:hypothetical protein